MVKFLFSHIFYSHGKESAINTRSLPEGVEIKLNDLLEGQGKSGGPTPAYDHWIKPSDYSFSFYEPEKPGDVRNRHCAVTLRTNIHYTTYKNYSTAFLTSGKKRYYGRYINYRKPRLKSELIAWITAAIVGLGSILGNLDKIIKFFTSYFH